VSDSFALCLPVLQTLMNLGSESLPSMLGSTSGPPPPACATGSSGRHCPKAMKMQFPDLGLRASVY
jgi:hypothetical protein